MCQGIDYLLNKVEQEGVIKGVVAARGGPKVTHLLFTDDSLLFCGTQMSDYNSIIQVLHINENASS